MQGARIAAAAAAGAILLGPWLLHAQDMSAPPPEVAPPASPMMLPPPPPGRPLSPADGRAIEQAILAASEFAFPAELEGAAGALDSPDPRARADANAALTRAAITLAADEHGELANPTAVDPNWALRAPYDPVADFTAAQGQGDVAGWAEALTKHNPPYEALLAAQKRYLAIQAHGGWPQLPPDLALKRGAKGKEVERLRERLAVEGYGALGDAAYDPALADEVSDFQRRHAMKPTGVINTATVAAMNVPVEARLKTLAANLERERWLPTPMPPDRIVADVAGENVILFEGDRPALFMRSIVGQPDKKTPLFASHVSSIEFNPAWHVPDDIAKSELYPKGRDYLARHGYTVENGQLVQHAGPQSSLGRVKFEMPDQFAVYLHDTPGHNLFAVDSRGRSHGCVRLQKPEDLAVALLADQGWTLDKVNDTIAKGDTRWVRPKTNMPVYLVYRTAEVVDEGPVIFRPDIYGWDDKLNTALASAR